MSVKTITVKLPILPARKLGGFHQEVASAELVGSRAVVSAGFGLGNTQMYVAINGKRVLSVDAAPLLRALIDAAVAAKKKEPKP